MRKILLGLSLLIVSLMLSACSDNEVSPDETLNSYTKEWNNQKFTDMYKKLSSDTKETYKKEDFIDRYEKIYKDLDIKDLKITNKTLSDKEIEKAKKSGEATYAITVKMDSIAGPIEFDKKLKLVREEHDDEKDWYVKWNPNFIFPNLKDGGKISLEQIEPKRGEILDRNQMPLAINDTAHQIGIIPDDFNEANKQQVANLLKISTDSIDKKLDADWVEPNLFVPLQTISKDNKSTYESLMDIPGVSSQDVTTRTYPTGKATSHLIGYVGKISAEEKEEHPDYGSEDMIGKRGLEKVLEKQLRGESGSKIIITQEDEEDTVLAEKKVKDGQNIQLTIDVNLQEKIYDSYDGEAGTSTAVNPKTGETLALVSSPGFDPSLFVNSISQSELEKLQDDTQQPLLNRFNSTYAPGSVMKPISAAIGLNEGTIKPDEGLTIKGKSWSNGKGWGDYKVKRVSESDKPVDVTDALIRSDNIYFAKQIVKMGDKNYVKGLKNYGFDQKIPFKYPIERSQISNSGNLKNEVLLANTSYGQGEIEVSPTQLAMAYTPILNKGTLLKPTLLKSEDTKQVWHDNVLNEKQADVLQKALRKVVTDSRGTAKVLKDEKVDISGKTGTAELKRSADEKGHENSWFVGYPTKDQDLLIAMMMEKTEKKGSIVTENIGKIISDWKK